MTDYNAIAHTYREAKSLPIRQYSEAFAFFQVLGSVDGLVVLDVACGDGYYTRALKRHGASRVLGVDSSHRMITYATREEEAHPLGIEYVLGEAETMDILGAFDLVTAAYLLVHATTRTQLAAMCQAIGKQLKPGGRFVALTINPPLMIDQLPRIEQYRSGVTVHGPLYEGPPSTLRCSPPVALYTSATIISPKKHMRMSCTKRALAELPGMPCASRRKACALMGAPTGTTISPIRILWFWKPRKEASYADPTRHPRGSAGHWHSPAFPHEPCHCVPAGHTRALRRAGGRL